MGVLERAHPVRHPDDLADLPAIAHTGDAQWSFTDSAGMVHTVPIRARMRSPNADVRRRATVEGLGVSRIVLTFCADLVKQKRLVRLLPDYGCTPLKIYALLPGRRLMPPKVRLFLDALDATAPLVERA